MQLTGFDICARVKTFVNAHLHVCHSEIFRDTNYVVINFTTPMAVERFWLLSVSHQWTSFPNIAPTAFARDEVCKNSILSLYSMVIHHIRLLIFGSVMDVRELNDGYCYASTGHRRDEANFTDLSSIIVLLPSSRWRKR